MNDLPVIASASLRAQAVELLEDRVLYGDWVPGTRLPTESELCAQLGVSRSVVRDAMRALAVRGLVDVRQGIGTVVTEVSDAAYSDAAFLLLLRSDVTVHEAVEARAAIEVALAGIAAEARKEDDLVSLREHFETMAAAAEARDTPLALEADLKFHVGILKATNLPVLVTLLRPMHQIIWITTLFPPAADGDAGRTGADYQAYDVELHRGVLDALEAGESEQARRWMRELFAFVGDPAYRELHSMSFRDAARLRAAVRAEMSQYAG
jgi:GntR family transcriptional regulator, transcriptional repressor for pyruvate dehydrogenase complex